MKIHLEDLLKAEKKIWVRLEDKFREDLFNKAIKETKSLCGLSKLLNREFGIKCNSTIYSWYKGKRPNKDNTKTIDHGTPLRILKFIASLAKTPMTEIEKHIDFIKGDGPANRVLNPKFPITLDEATASVISHTLHDGYLEPKKLGVVYSNKEKENLEHFKQSVVKMFNASKVEFGEIESKGGIRVDAPNIVGCVLVCFGLQPGNKLKNDATVPEALLNCRKEIVITSYLGVVIADDGCVVKQSKQVGGYVSVQLNGLHQYKPSNLLVHDKIMFDKLGIHASKPRLGGEKETKKGEKRYKWYFRIMGQRNLLNLQKMGIPLTRKQQLLNQIVNSYTYFQDAILLENKFRMKLFANVIEKFGAIVNLNQFLTRVLKRNISEGSIHDWRKGRYHCPVDVVICLVKLCDISSVNVAKNIKSYKPYRISKTLEEIDQNLLSEFWKNHSTYTLM